RRRQALLRRSVRRAPRKRRRQTDGARRGHRRYGLRRGLRGDRAARPMNVDAYLERIGHSGSTTPTPQTLKALHRAHLLTVPFENLDIALGVPIELDLEAFFDKIVVRRRGGFCYELNGLFGWLLRELRFPVATLSARVLDGGRIGPDFDHMLLLVRLEDRLIADVGFG